MKAILLIISIVALFLFGACQNASVTTENSAQNQITKQNDSLRLQIYYFHTTHRCPTCNSIESNMKLLVENEFKTEVEKGLIDFKVINIDVDSNRVLAEIYEAFGSSLYLAEHKNGKEIDHNFTDFAFAYSRNEPEKFLKEMSDTIRAMY